MRRRLIVGVTGAEAAREWGVMLEMDAAIRRRVGERWGEFFPELRKEAECAGA